MKVAFEFIALALLLVVMAAAALFGMLMNVLVLWLMACVAWTGCTRLIGFLRKRLYVGIWRRTEYPASRPYLIQAVWRTLFWATVGIVIVLSLVPIQIPANFWRYVLLQLWGAIAILCLLEWVPSRHISWPSNVAFSLLFMFLVFQLAKIHLPPSGTGAVVVSPPFEGDWYAIQGGNSCLTNHHYYVGSQRFALDLILPEDGPLDWDGTPDLEDYRTYGQPLFSPVDGLVVDIENELPDQPIGDSDPIHAAGNSVTIKTDSGAFVLLAHLQEGSVLVRENERVQVGQPLAKCGNSGNSSHPHLHLQAMTAPDIYSPKSLPLLLKFSAPNGGESGPYRRNDLIHGIASSHGGSNAQASQTPQDSPVRHIEKLRAPEFDDVSTLDGKATTEIDAWLREQVALANYPSVSVAIVRDGKISYQRAIGLADLESRSKATIETSYHVASVTKVFTTSLTALLHGRGVIDLDQPAIKYLPPEVAISTSPDRGATITLRQLASHTSGLPRDLPGPVQSVDGRYELEPQRLYDQLSKVSLEFEPGTNELYSNLGMGLLGHLLERAAGKPFDWLLDEFICEPLHLDQTAIPLNDKLPLAVGYGDGLPRRPEEHSYRDRLAPSGGLVASAPDLARFLAAQMEPGFFSSDMLEWLHRETTLSNGTVARTALGWSVRTHKPIGRTLKKNGGRSNCSAWIGFAPEHMVGVAVVSNCGDPAVDSIGYWLLERLVPGVDPTFLHRQPVVEHIYAKVAPFTGVRWEKDQPIVCVKDRWHPLVSIDGIPVVRIVKFAEKEHGARARKRFAEDLVELLSMLGHEPKWTVVLGVNTSEGKVENIEAKMTEQNRDRVRD
ncbi:MAG: serine hydrolase [Pirellulales bacterium]|nr:serine hydrolase [Pirellulales bacterium]